MKPDPEFVFRVVAESFGLPVASVIERGQIGGCPDPRIVHARWAAFWLLKRHGYTSRNIRDATGHPIGTVHAGDHKAAHMLKSGEHPAFYDKLARAAKDVHSAMADR